MYKVDLYIRAAELQSDKNHHKHIIKSSILHDSYTILKSSDIF